MDEKPTLDYQGPSGKMKKWGGPGCRDATTIATGVFGFLICMGLSKCISFMTAIKYIPGAFERPITPEDQRSFYIADILSYTGYGFLAAAIVMLFYFAIRYGRKR